MGLIIEAFPDARWVEISKKTYIRGYFTHYLEQLPRKNDPISIIYEANHIDKDFLIDYACFYSRCFEEVPKKVTRAHFFYGTPENIRVRFNKILSDGLENSKIEHEQLLRDYIGFTTIRPIHSKVVGRTAFIQYPQDDGQGNERHYPVFVENNIHICGIPFLVKALPYQEQDTTVAACATTAIWCALQAIRKKFDIGTFYSPYEITNLAFESSGNYESRRFPNEGLKIIQIMNVITKMGFDTQFVDGKTIPSKKYMDEVITSHLDFGLPILGLLTLVPSVGKPDWHLVTIAGYKYSKSSNELIELYIHDDQIGFYSKVEFVDSSHMKWKNEWISPTMYKEVVVRALIIPTYHKIRLAYSQIVGFLMTSFKDENAFSIKLIEVSCAKQKIMAIGITNFIEPDLVESFISNSQPKYLWYVDAVNKSVRSITCYDATSYYENAICTLYYK